MPVTSPVNTTLTIHWSKVNTGAAGAAGQSAVVFSLYAPNGTVFVNGEGSLTIQTSAYSGSTPIASGATYAWAKYASGQLDGDQRADRFQPDSGRLGGQGHGQLPLHHDLRRQDLSGHQSH